MIYSLIIPIYNEQRTLSRLIGELKNLDEKIEIILIDDGSTDETKKLLKNQKSFKIIYNHKNMGKGYSLIKGVEHAKAKNIILMDGDLEIELKSVINLIKDYKINKNQVLVGSRWGNENKVHKSVNAYGNFFFNYLFNSIYQTNVTDVLCCVKVINKDLFNSLELKSTGFSIEMEIMTKLALKNIAIYEKQVVYNRRDSRDGKKIKLSDGWGILWEIIANKFFS